MFWDKWSTKVRTEVKYQVVELDQARTPLQVGKEAQESIQTLSSHPGFLALMHQHQLTLSMLKTKLAKDLHKDMREVDFLQAGIFWSDWYLQQVKHSTMKMSQRISDATKDEEDLFGAVDANLELVGGD